MKRKMKQLVYWIYSFTTNITITVVIVFKKILLIIDVMTTVVLDSFLNNKHQTIRTSVCCHRYHQRNLGVSQARIGTYKNHINTCYKYSWLMKAAFSILEGGRPIGPDQDDFWATEGILNRTMCSHIPVV